MDRFQRLIRAASLPLICFGAWVAFCVVAMSQAGAAPAPVSALTSSQVSAQSVVAYSISGWNFAPASAQAICDEAAAAQSTGVCPNGAAQKWTGALYGVSGTSGGCAMTLPSCFAGGKPLVQDVLLTGAGQTIDTCSDPNAKSASGAKGTACQCASGYVSDPAHGSCVVAPAAPPVTPPASHACPSFGTFVPEDESIHYTYPGMQSMSNFCNKGCAEIPAGVAVDGNGVAEYEYGGGYATGGACGSNAAAGAATIGQSAKAPDASPVTGPAAQCEGATACFGAVGGTTVCVACGSSDTTTVSATNNTSPSGAVSTTTTATTVATHTDGTTTTTSTTTNSDGSQSTTVTTGQGGSGGGSGGSGGGSSGGSGSGVGGGKCTGTNCGDSTDSFGGQCTAAFECSGDAVQCSIATEQHQRDCALFQPETQGGALAEQAHVGSQARNDGDVPTWSPASPTNAASAALDFTSSLDQSHPFGSTCPADQSVGSFMGSELVIPWGNFCSSLELAGHLVVAVTFVGCAFIVFKS